MIDEVAKILDLLGKRIVDCLLLELAGVIDGLEHQEVPFGLFSRIEIRCVTLWPRSRRIGKSLALRSCGHPWPAAQFLIVRSEEHTSELQSLMPHLVCRLLLEKKKNKTIQLQYDYKDVNLQI